ncbi:SLC13 family permease [Actinomadura parmotrematis]|uniref:Arsenic transporter n=1 Tax=Actinomadura parmotrematis TaxID=2864039 RepID=A0ABS7FL75_9ACTN|nr:SLC13 family permease [Actinomadura parmotrematis]MBW8481109.1 arsenic transporter [Actinomadura parmotrematis]
MNRPSPRRALSGLRALGPLDRVRLGVLALGLLLVATGAVPAAEARAGLGRIAPLLLFLAAVVVLAELTRRAGVFDAVAQGLARAGRGRYPALFALCLLFASVTTAFLNLDTTAVLLTPVMLALAARSDIAAPPLAMTTVWLANTASLLLPVSNLTNLLAAGRVGLGTGEFAARMAAPQLAALLATAVLLWALHWRRGARGADRYTPPPPEPVRDRVLFGAGTAACLLFAAAILAGISTGYRLGAAAACAAAVVVIAFAVRDRPALTWRLLPWQLMVFVTGLFLVVPALERLGLDALTRVLAGGGEGAGEGAGGLFRTAFAGAGLANLLNNLPAYVAGERAVPAGDTDGLLALLIGTNAGAVITPWGSLATLLWFEWCRRYGVRVPVARFAAGGALLAVTACAAAVAALAATR